MRKIELCGQPSGGCGFFAFDPGTGHFYGGEQWEEKPPLERLVNIARKLGFELVTMDVAEIHHFGENYISPIIFLKDPKKDSEAVISQRKDEPGIIYSIDYYKEISQNIDVIRTY